MEPIKITDKLTLRQEALRMAIDFISATKTGAGWQGIADSFERYLQGSADLPERDNAMEKYLQELKDSVLNFKPNPWISADSEMKPAKDTDVLCLFEKEVYVARFDGVGWYSSETVKALDPTHWMPIPPFTQPTL